MAPEKFEVVISGVGGSFPECKSFHEFSDLLFSGKSGVTVDNRRWPVGALDTPPASGKIPSFKEMDSTFFGMTPGLTDVTDPLTRLSLEKCIEALLDAGVNPTDLSGTNTGVMVGSCVSESEFIQLFSMKKLAILGANRAMQANRISFFLNLTGPSYQLDNTWVGGFQCLEQANALVGEGIVDGCLVCVANLTISPCVSKQMQGLGVLTPDECTRSLSSDASGYVRSEAVVAFYLQRLADAKRSYGSLVNIGVGTYGGRKGIFAENCSPDQFRSLMEDVYKDVDSNLIGYVEADGCGVKAVDAMECSVMKQVLLRNRKRPAPLLVGSVKSNVGHAEASSALVSVSKALVTLDSGLIPPTLNYKEPNPAAEGLNTGEMKVVTETTPLPTPLVGVTSIGLCSSFGHLVLKQHSKAKAYHYRKHEMYRDDLPRLITMSGRTEQGLRDILKEIKTYPADEEFAALFHEVFKTTINQHNIRGYVLTPDTCPEDETENLEQVEYYEGRKKPIWFIFSGMGSQWNEMGRDLLKIPLFRASMGRLAAVLEPRGVDLFQILTSPDKSLFDNILNSFVGIAACQIGLVDILFALGITPDGIVGHSVGELGCAYADGCFTAEQMILAAYARGKASIETDTIDGKMAAIGLGQAQMRDILKDKPSIEIACHNAADSCTLSGPSADIDALVESLVAQGIFARAVNVANIAYHSRYIAPAAPRLLRYLKEVIPAPKPRSSKWISSSILEAAWDSPLAATSSPEYHTNNLLSSVFFEEASVHIPSDAICIEIAPHGLLQAILKRSLADRKVTNVPLTLRGVKDGVRFLLHSVGKLYLQGLELSLSPLYPEVQFPVSRGTRPLGQFLDWEHSQVYDLNELEVETILRFEREVSISISDHILYSSQLLHEARVLPCAKLLLTALESLPILQDREPFDESLIMQAVHFVRAVRIPTKRALKMYLMIGKGSGQLEISLDEGTEPTDTVMTGRVDYLARDLSYGGYQFPGTLAGGTSQDREPEETLLGDEVFAYMRQFGLSQDTRCQCIKELNIYQGGSLARAVIDFVSDDWLLFLDNLIKVLVYLHLQHHRQVLLPSNIERLLFDKQLFMNSIKERNTTFVDVYYDLDTKEVQCSGLHMFGVQMKPLNDIPLPSSVFNVKNLAFVPYHNPTLATTSQLSLVCLQLLLENVAPVEKGFKVNVNLIHINTTNNAEVSRPSPDIADILRVLSLQSNIEHRIIEFNGKHSEQITSEGKVLSNQQCYNLILCDDSSLTSPALAVLTANTHSYLLLRTLRHGLLNLDASLNVVSSAEVAGAKYLFVKNNSEWGQSGESHVVFALNVNHLDSGAWKSELKAKIEEAIESNSNVFIVVDAPPPCPIRQFIKLLFLQDEFLSRFFQLFRFFFILDHSAPLFCPAGKFYEDQISLQMRVNIYKEGRWGAERYLLSDNYRVGAFAYDQSLQYGTSNYLKEKMGGELNIKYLCISNKHLIVDEQFGEDRTCHELGPLEYAGTSPGGQKRIGIAPFHRGVQRIQPDPILSWALPEGWGLEDGATVPLSYSIAYYILKPPQYERKQKKFSYVLLSTGVNSIGLAFLNLLVHRRGEHDKVFMCVKTTQHRDYIARWYAHYVEADYLQVVLYQGRPFEVDVRFATQGVGADLIINSLSGRYFRSALNCASLRFPTIVQLNSKDAIDQVKIGMSIFLQCTELQVFGSEDLLALSDEVKREVGAAVAAGLESGVVRPFPRQVLSGPYTGAEALDKLNSSIGGDNIERIVLSLERERPKSLLPAPSVNVKYTFESDKSYLIVGGKAGSWLDLAEFLLLRGARHILVLCSKTSLAGGGGAVASRRLNCLLVRYPACDIQMSGPAALDSRQEAEGRLRASAQARELSAVFLLHMDSEARLQNLHAVLRGAEFQYTLLISLYSGDAALCEGRRAQGYPTLCVQTEGDEARRLDRVLNILDTLLLTQLHARGAGSATVLVDHVGSATSDKDYMILQNIKAHLPESLEELQEVYEQEPSGPVWEEVQSLTARLSDSIGSYPIFIVPGLRPHTRTLQAFIQRLYHPCFLCKYPYDSEDLDKTAELLVRELDAFNLQTFNLVAESWGGLLALHIAKRLTTEGRYVRLSLLDAAPETILSWVSYFSDNLEIKLLSKYFPISYKDKQELATLSWQDKLSHLLASAPPRLAPAYASSLTYLLTRLRSVRSSLLNTEADRQSMAHVKVLLLRPEASSESDSCNLERICSGPIAVHVGTEPDYLRFLSEPATAVQVNENFLYHYPEAETPLYLVPDISAVYECKLFNLRVTKT